MEEEWNQLQVGNDKSVQWGFQDERFNEPSGLFVDVLQHQWPDGRPRGVCSDRIEYRQHLSESQRSLRTLRERVRKLDGIQHRDSILRDNGVTAEMQAAAEADAE